jgi:hypothetical protein
VWARAGSLSLIKLLKQRVRLSAIDDITTSNARMTRKTSCKVIDSLLKALTPSSLHWLRSDILYKPNTIEMRKNSRNT